MDPAEALAYFGLGFLDLLRIAVIGCVAILVLHDILTGRLWWRIRETFSCSRSPTRPSFVSEPCWDKSIPVTVLEFRSTDDLTRYRAMQAAEEACADPLVQEFKRLEREVADRQRRDTCTHTGERAVIRSMVDGAIDCVCMDCGRSISGEPNHGTLIPLSMSLDPKSAILKMM